MNNTNTTILVAYFLSGNLINENILNDLFSSLDINYVIRGEFNSKHPY